MWIWRPKASEWMSLHHIWDWCHYLKGDLGELLTYVGTGQPHGLFHDGWPNHSINTMYTHWKTQHWSSRNPALCKAKFISNKNENLGSVIFKDSKQHPSVPAYFVSGFYSPQHSNNWGGRGNFLITKRTVDSNGSNSAFIYSADNC